MPRRTSSTLHLQHTLFSAILLKCANEGGSNGEYGPLAVGWRVCLRPGWRRTVDDVLVAPCNVGAIARGVESGHGGRGAGGVGGAWVQGWAWSVPEREMEGGGGGRRRRTELKCLEALKE